MKGYGIARYEQNLPAGAVIDEVRYSAKGGQRVSCVIGTVKVDDRANMRDTRPATDGPATAMTGERSSMVGGRTVMVTWDSKGLCRVRSNGERLPEFDIKLDGSWK